VSQLIMRLERLADAPASPAWSGADGRSRHIVDLSDEGRAAMASTPLARWIAAVGSAHEPCLVLDRDGRVLALSRGASELLGCSDIGVIGRALLDVVEVVDFDNGAANPEYAARVAPLAVLSAGSGLMRSLLRVRRRDSARATLDASSAPIHDSAARTVGSLTFLAPVLG
jgi:PAS domain-containing protein